MHALLVGTGLGATVAIQVGPMTLLLIRSTLRRGLAVGLAIGAGIAAIDALYAALGAAGVGPALTNDVLRVVLGLAGAALLVALGLRTLWSALRVRLGGEIAVEVATPRRAFATALAGTASNPLTIVSWAGLFAAATAAGAADSPLDGAALVLGVGLGSLACTTSIACAMAAGRRRIGDALLRTADAAAGLALAGFGAALAAETVTAPRSG